MFEATTPLQAHTISLKTQIFISIATAYRQLNEHILEGIN